jgi:DNA polymerase-1
MAKEYRKIFVAPAGYVLIEADFSQIELRIAAIMAQEPTMLNRLNRKRHKPIAPKAPTMCP